jgi:hypothetical protein
VLHDDRLLLAACARFSIRNCTQKNGVTGATPRGRTLLGRARPEADHHGDAGGLDDRTGWLGRGVD